MSAPILLTKLFIPTNRPELISRSHLIGQLNRGLHRKLTLISAPAGFGKTTLVTDWLQSHWLSSKGDDVSSPFWVAWLSLDEGDNDAVRFLTYLITALNRIPGLKTEIGVGALQMVQSPQPPPLETILVTVINELVLVTNKIVLVLDDYHLIDAPQIHESLKFLIENLPPQLHLVITTREDPPIQISRLRARGQLGEIRAVDLRFTSAETAQFLNQVMGLKLSAEDIAALETRTEGWITGLQMAAISMHGSKDVDGFIKSFTGSHRYVLDYLIEEVLEQQTEEIQTFLLQTAFLDRLNGSLCDAVTNQKNGQDTLEMLDRANLFIAPLDNEKCWYRYHHLFGGLLRQRLKQTQSDQLPILYAKASRWFEQNGFIDDAIDNALRADDFERTTNLLGEQIDDYWSQGENAKLKRWLEKIPQELLISKPNLCIFHAWYLYLSGQLDQAETTLQLTEQAIDFCKSDKAVLRGRSAAVRAFMLAGKMDVQSIILHAHHALELLPETEVMWRSLTATVLGDAHAYKGDMTAAYEARVEALKSWKATDNIYWILVANLKLASSHRAQGQLQSAIEICQQQMEVVNEFGLSQIRAISWLLAIWGEGLAEINDLEAATHLTERIIELTKHSQDAAMIGWNCICLMRISFSKGDIPGADKIIQEMEKKALESNVQPWLRNLIAAWQTRVWLAQAKLESATQWAQEHDANIDGEIPWVREIENIVLARVFIAQVRLDEAIDLLQHLFEDAKTGGRISKAIEILILQSLAYQAGDDTAQAVNVLEKALRLAKPRGFIRTFVDEGPPMARLLYEALSRDIAPDYVRKLLAAFPDAEPEKVTVNQLTTSDSDWIEPLSDRELEVLQLVAKGLSRQEIAAQLVLSLNTVKTHVRNIYSKLGVNNQMQAVGKVRGLGLLENK